MATLPSKASILIRRIYDRQCIYDKQSLSIGSAWNACLAVLLEVFGSSMRISIIGAIDYAPDNTGEIYSTIPAGIKMYCCYLFMYAAELSIAEPQF